MKLVNKFSRAYKLFVYFTSDIKYFKQHFIVYYLILFQIRNSRKSISEGNFYDKVK